MKVTRCSLNLWIPDLCDDHTCRLEDHRGRPVPGQVVITPDGKYTYEADMDGVSVTKTRTGMVSKTIETIETGGTDLRDVPSGVAITQTTSK